MCDSLDNQKKERLVKQDKNTKKKSDLTLMIMKKYKLRKCEKKGKKVVMRDNIDNEKKNI